MSKDKAAYKVDPRAEKAAKLFIACEQHDKSEQLKIPDAMRARGYSDTDAQNRTLQQQVRREVTRIKGQAAPQLSRIFNVDETEISLDGSKTSAGGRPSVTFIDRKLSVAVKAATKSSWKCTGLFGSTAAGETIPPHFQLPTAAQKEEREKVRIDIITHMRKTRGQFGHNEVKEWPATFGLNEKGGMNNVEFDSYLDNGIYPLYPDMEDVPRKRVCGKVDSGPGREFDEMLCKARFRGLYLFPSLPNVTSVSQETDQNYGLFKSIVRRNLEDVSTEAFKQRKELELGASLMGLICFGGIHDDTGVTCRSAVDEGFSEERNNDSWDKVGAAGRNGITMKCLESKKVRHDGTDKDDPNYDMYQDIQSKNDYSTCQLTVMGYKGQLLQATFKEDKIKAKQSSTVTVENTRERQEALLQAKTHGAKFHVTGGTHATADDLFISAELANKSAQTKKLEKDKEARLEATKNHEAAIPVVEKLKTKGEKKLSDKDLEIILKAKGVKTSKMGNKANKLSLVKDFMSKDVEAGKEGLSITPKLKPWTQADEAQLIIEINKPLTMKDTAYARFEQQKKKDAELAYKKMSASERQAFLSTLSQIDQEEEMQSDDEEENDSP